MKLKTLAVLLIALCAFCVLEGGLNAPAFADGTQTLTLSLLSGGYTTSQLTTDYTLTIPADFEVTKKGWNDIGSIAVTVSIDKVFSTDKKVVVTAESANSFKMTSGTAEIGYTLKAAEDDESAPTEFSFSAEDINSGTASQDLGISITWDSSQPAGSYTDTITYTGEVQDAATGSTVDLATITGAYTAQDGETLTGTAGSEAHITVAAGATIKLMNATINSIPNDESHKWAGITCAGDATIILEGTNELKGGYDEYPGIYVPQNATLTIKGSGSLTASSNGYGAGIGGGYNISCGNIVIEDGNITARCNYGAAGIGGGNNASCGDITISGGTVSATGSPQAAGIGSGENASCGDITISGGTVSATGGTQAAGIGGGWKGSCGDITITDGVTSVTVTKGTSAPNSIGAGADGATSGTVTIADGANVTQN